MSQCLNPDCLYVNSDKTQICQQCGSQLILVNRYRAIKLLGQGGFGRTFLALDEFKPSKSRCVIKQFLPDVKSSKARQKAAELFEREAMRLDELGKHDQIPELLAFFNQEERQYLIQEFIDGDDLQKELETKGVFNEQQIRELLDDLLSVLKFVHANNVIHRDIKPENIIRRKKDGKLVLVDFGAAKESLDIDKTKTGTIIGSAAYIAPEQAVGKPKFASDLYSLGTTCLHLLTNIEPPDLFDTAEGVWMWRDYLEDNEIEYELSRVLDKLVEGATKRRFQSVDEVLAALHGTPPTPAIRTMPYGNPTSARTRLPSLSTRNSSQTKVQPSLKSPKNQKSPQQPKLDLKIFEFNSISIAYEPDLSQPQRANLSTKHYPGKAKYITLNLGKGITMDLVGIPGGKFLMGSPANEVERGEDESPQHWVKVRPFLLGKFPVTQTQWQAIMNHNPARFTSPNLGNSKKPVEKVSWFDCQIFCQQLSELVDREIRLPTEAEWEYACRGKTTTPFYLGATISTEFANYNGEFAYDKGLEGENRQQTTDVDLFPPNRFGLYDLHGNVAEWCADSWHNSYVNAPTDGSAWTNDNSKEPRILRGGSWLHLPGCCRSAHRLSSAANNKSDAFGFRVASSI